MTGWDRAEGLRLGHLLTLERRTAELVAFKHGFRYAKIGMWGDPIKVHGYVSFIYFFTFDVALRLLSYSTSDGHWLYAFPGVYPPIVGQEEWI